MWLKRLALRNFRNYESEDIYFCNRANLIFGQNAQGKTNILEAISLLSTGRSFRTKNLSDAILSGSDCFFIEAIFEKEGIQQSLSLSYDGQNKKIKHNDTVYPSFVSLFGILPSVFIVPEDISLIIGMPSERRRFIDMHIAQTDPLYVYHLARYYKAMKHRNTLLKQQNSLELKPWEEIMSQAAAYLVCKREEHINQLCVISQKIMTKLSDRSDMLTLRYKLSMSTTATSDLKTHFVQMYEKSRQKEMLLGSTLYGPHKDDLEIIIQDKAARFFASEGQKRSAITALLLSQKELIKERSGIDPLIGIDDFGAHFDEKRNKELITLTQSHGQTFLTSPLSSHELEGINGRIFMIEQGSTRAVSSLSV
jgi:DNA replication and repair protein RecF